MQIPHPDHKGVPGPVAALLGDLEEPVDFLWRQVLATGPACGGIKESAVILADTDLTESQVSGLSDGINVMVASIQGNAQKLDSLLNDLAGELSHEH